MPPGIGRGAPFRPMGVPGMIRPRIGGAGQPPMYRPPMGGMIRPP